MNHPLVKYIIGNQVVAAVLLVALGLFLIEIKGILVILFISYILSATLIPFVRFFTKKGIPQCISVLITYLLFSILLVTLIFPLIPFFISQIQIFFEKFPNYVESTARIVGIQANTKEIQRILSSEISAIGENAFIVTSRIFGGLFSIFAVIVISLYSLLNRDNIVNNLASWFPKSSQNKAILTISQIEEKLGAWARGQVILSIFIAFMTGVSLSVLGMNFALPLAVIAGILEIVPTIGPIISAIPAIIVALTISPTMALTVAGVYIVIQLLENHVFVPNIMHKSVGLNPLLVIVSVMLGSNLMGVLGALLSVPFVTMMIIIFNSFRTEK